ncbi:helix-turn-helix domain-containing protein [Streptococcus uberis]|nr:helix-turn-helix transcriptional regulator [Streptococcus uberis]MCK1196418.1 helix-turn-helix domain-containing protein [Streptococcus uberis]
MNNLKKLREEKAISQIQFIEEIAKPPYKLNVSRRTLQYWESGERDIKIDKAKILAKYFDVSVPYLLGFYTVIKPDEKKKKRVFRKKK